jgi:hypothetical protein
MRKFLATLLLALFLPGMAHAQQNRAGLVNTYNSQLPSNNKNLINAGMLRGVMNTLTNSITAIFGDNNVIPNNMLNQAPAGSVKANVGGTQANVVDVPLATFFGSAPNASIPSSAVFGSLPGNADTGFQPGGSYATLSVTQTTSNVALPTGATIIVYNKGANPAYVALGDGSITAAVTNDVVAANSWLALVVGANTNIAAIADTGKTTTLTISGGTGLPTGAGGGGGGTSSGPNTAQGAAISGVTGGLSLGSVVSGTPSFSNATAQPFTLDLAGNVRVDLTTAIPTGTNVIGHVINDASSAVIGHVIADSGSTTAVTALPSLPAGTNVIGHIICDTGCLPTAGTFVTDRSAFTAGSSQFAGVGGTYNVSIPTLADGQQGTVALTNNRSMHVLEDNSSTISSSITAGNATLSSILTGVTSAIPAGTNVIGHVIADTGSTTAVSSLPALPAGTNTIGNVGQTSQYPSGATPETISATGTTGATTATLAATSGKTTYICGFSIRANATAAATGNATVTGTITGTLNFTQWTAPNASGLGINEQVFTPCIPASATNTTIPVVSAAPGSGGVVSVTAWGYEL